MGGDFKCDEDSSVGSCSPTLGPADSSAPAPAGHLGPSDSDKPSPNHLQPSSNLPVSASTRSSTITSPGLDHTPQMDENHDRYRHLQARVDDEDEYMGTSDDIQRQPNLAGKIEAIRAKQTEMYENLDSLRQQLNGLLPAKELGPDDLLEGGLQLDQMKEYARRLFYEDQRLARCRDSLASRENEVSEREVSLNMNKLSLDDDRENWSEQCKLELLRLFEDEIARVGSDTRLDEPTLIILKDAIMAQTAGQQPRPPAMAIELAATPFKENIHMKKSPTGLKYPSEIVSWSGFNTQLVVITEKSPTPSTNGCDSELADVPDSVNPASGPSDDIFSRVLFQKLGPFLAYVRDNKYEMWDKLGLGSIPRIEAVNSSVCSPTTMHPGRYLTRAIYQIGGYSLPIVAGEHTSPTSLTSEQMMAGAGRDILPENEIIDQRVSGAEAAWRRELTLAISRLYTYMVARGIRFGYITNSECCVLLRISDADPKRVKHFVWRPAPDIATGSKTDKTGSMLTSFIMHAMAQPLPSQQWYESLASVPTWPTEVVDDGAFQPSIQPSAPGGYNGNEERVPISSFTASFDNCFNSSGSGTGSSRFIRTDTRPNGPGTTGTIHNSFNNSFNSGDSSAAPNIPSENPTGFNSSFNGEINSNGIRVGSTRINATFRNCFRGCTNREQSVLSNMADVKFENCFNGNSGHAATVSGTSSRTLIPPTPPRNLPRFVPRLRNSGFSNSFPFSSDEMVDPEQTRQRARESERARRTAEDENDFTGSGGE